MRRIRSFALMIAAAAMAACASSPAMPDSDAELTGTVADFQPSSAPDYSLRMLVARDAPEPGDRTIVHLKEGTPVRIIEAGGRIRLGAVRDLVPGDRVQVWTTGIELRSYPAQVFAVRIHVVR